VPGERRGSVGEKKDHILTIKREGNREKEDRQALPFRRKGRKSGERESSIPINEKIVFRLGRRYVSDPKKTGGLIEKKKREQNQLDPLLMAGLWEKNVGGGKGCPYWGKVRERIEVDGVPQNIPLKVRTKRIRTQPGKKV